MKIFSNTSALDGLFKESGIELISSPEDAELLVLGAKRADFSQFRNLKAVYRFGIGSENVDFEYLKNKSIPVFFPGEKAKQVLYESVANFTVFAILKLFYADALGDISAWKKKKRDFLGDKTALVVGTGNIGKRVVDKLSVFLKVKTFDALKDSQEQLEPLIREADIITVHIPMVKENINFFNVKRLSWVKNEAIIINTSRGEIFDEEALYQKLIQSGCKAFFDVFWQEPYNGKLKSLGKGKFFMTPHTASNTNEFTRECFVDILRIIKTYKNG